MDSQFQVFAAHRPLLYGDCRGLVFSPHCAQYPGMHTHVAAAGLSTAVTTSTADDSGNQWDRPVHIHSRAGPVEGTPGASGGERDRT